MTTWAAVSATSSPRTAPGSPNWPSATATGMTTPKKEPAYGM